MATWTIIASIAFLCISLGNAFDKLVMLNRHKNSIHLKMLAWWNALDETNISDLPRLMAGWIIKMFKPVFRWNVFSWKMIIFCFFFSWVLTTISAPIGFFIGNKELMIGLPYFNYYMVNFPFDFIIIVVTIKILLKVKNYNYRLSIIYNYIYNSSGICYGMLFFIYYIYR